MNPIEKMLRENTGRSFAHIETVTDPCKTSKKVQSIIVNMGHRKIFKIGSRNVSIGNSYENAVGNRLEKNDQNRENFKAQPRAWAERINQGLIRHKDSGQLYFEYYYLSNAPTTSKFVWENGVELTEEELAYAKENLFKKSSSSAKQSKAGLSEEQQVRVNIIKIQNVRSIKAFGKIAWQEPKQ